MSQGDTTLTIIGNLTADPELRFTPSGAAVANLTIASTPRVYDKNTNEWKDGETLFMRCSIWREAAENVAESLFKGMRVIAEGKLKQRSYDTKEGEKRTVVEMELDEIGPSLRYARAKVDRNARGGGGGGGGGSRGGGQRGPSSGPPAGVGGFGGGNRNSTSNRPASQEETWGPSGGGGNYDWGQGQEEEPPF